MRVLWIGVLLALTTGGLAQSARPAPQTSAATWHGKFSASIGRSEQVRGRWSGQGDTKNSGSGSWILLNDSNQVIAEGTWTAQKTGAAWTGTWRAWVKGSRQYSGSWQAELEGFSGKSFEDMLNHTLEQQVMGSWRSGKLEGNWWLQGTKW
jgi:hypothetical protein